MNDEALPLIGRDIRWDSIEDVWIFVRELVSIAKLEGDKVVGAERGVPYAFAHVSLLRSVDPPDKIETAATLPVSHREDFKAIHWLFNNGRLPGEELMLRYEPSGLFGSFKPRFQVEIYPEGALDYHRGVLEGTEQSPFDRVTPETVDEAIKEVREHMAVFTHEPGRFRVPT